MKTKLLTCIGALIFAATAVHPSSARAATTSPSELLEKGIYNEETKGDLDSAIAIYQQLVAEANANQSLAAQAQMRLGQCYLKKNQTTEATVAFQKLIHDFPNEKELVAKAREFLPGDLEFGPVPWVDGERLQLNIALATGIDLGVMEYRADLMQSGAQKIWRVGARLSAGAQSVSSVDADAETFRSISSHWKHSLLGDVSAIYKPDEVDLQRDGSAQPTKVALAAPVIDNEEAMHAMRRLPLKVGYNMNVTVFSSLGGNAVPLGLEVTGTESVEVPAGKFDCFKVQLSIGQSFWFSDDAHRYLVKFEAGPAIASLTSISQHKPGELVQFRDDELGISLTAPADWIIWRARHGQTEKQELIRTFDPEADAEDGGLRLFATDSLSVASQQSARAWAEKDFKENQTLKDIKIRPNSWQNYNVSGRPGVSYLADYTESGKARVLFLLYAIGSKNSERFALLSTPEKFDALKTAFDSIIASYRITK